MKESEPKVLEGVSSYESQVKKEYSELGKEGVKAENWGTMITPSGERFNGYTDKRFIRSSFTEPIQKFTEGKKGLVTIADFGGDDGFLLNEVLSEMGNQNGEVKGLVIDIDSTGKAKERFVEKQTAGERKDMAYMVADITKLPLANESLDIVISRMTMQYLNQEQQEQFLKEISRVLRQEGLCLMQTITEETANKDFNQVWNEITKIISQSPDFKRHFPRFGEFTNHIRFSEQSGLTPVFSSRKVKFPFSVSAFTERFQVDKTKLTQLFREKSKQFPDLFEVIDGQICLKARLLNLHLKKNYSQ